MTNRTFDLPTLTPGLAAATSTILHADDDPAAAELWDTLSPDLIGLPLDELTASVEGLEATVERFWRRCRKALQRAVSPGPSGPVSRGLHDVVSVVGDVTAIATAARMLAEPVATFVRRLLHQRRQRRQDEHGVQIEVDLPPAAGAVDLPSGEVK